MTGVAFVRVVRLQDGLKVTVSVEPGSALVRVTPAAQNVALSLNDVEELNRALKAARRFVMNRIAEEWRA